MRLLRMKKRFTCEQATLGNSTAPTSASPDAEDDIGLILLISTVRARTSAASFDAGLSAKYLYMYE